MQLFVRICSYSAPICGSRKSAWLHLVETFLRQKSERRIQEGREDRHQQQQRQSMKVIDKINNGLANHNGVVFSFEFFPPRTEEGIENLYDRMDRMVVHQPAFCDITWGAGGSTSALALDIANKMQNMVRNYKPESSNQSLEFEIWICFFLQFEIWCCLYLLLLWWASQSNEFSIFLWFLEVLEFFSWSLPFMVLESMMWCVILPGEHWFCCWLEILLTWVQMFFHPQFCSHVAPFEVHCTLCSQCQEHKRTWHPVNVFSSSIWHSLLVWECRLTFLLTLNFYWLKLQFR